MGSYCEGVQAPRCLPAWGACRAHRCPSLSAAPDKCCSARSTVAALSLSVVSSVALVIVNKYLISTLGFPYGMLLHAPLLFLLSPCTLPPR